MKKYKWISIKTDYSLEKLVEKLSLDPFTEEKGKGFIFNKVRKEYSHGKFVEKLIIQDKLPSLFGEEEIIERTEYRVTEFEINKEHLPIVSLINPPRTLKPFSIAFSKNLGLGVSIEDIEINPYYWALEINKYVDIKIIQVDLSQIKVSEYALAKMQINSTHDLNEYFKANNEFKHSRIDRIICSILSPTFNGKIKLFRSGMSHVETKHENEISKILFDAMMRL
ncbi:hypothetical protein REJ26_000423 [Providencia stuartii]|uniref:hypothetical protein n=1 Tax=Providencia TaxID=586 RepID=UPI00294027E8|nr:hypothetical protein [Providencia sp. 2023EL-00965]ELR5298704.1 hypothetical protein [Providencia stuartii]MDW7587156.1 hypothetical protein [Providencia sp. 2023EL-00965]